MLSAELKRKHDIARQIIENRYHHVPFDVIARNLNLSGTEIRKLRTGKIYKQQVWAEYGRECHLFTQHKKQEMCIRHISRFFDISREKATEILGKDWKPPPPPEPIQLTIGL